MVRRAIAAEYLVHQDGHGTPDGTRTRLIHASCRRELQARKRRMPAPSPHRPRGLLEPCASMRRTHGSEGPRGGNAPGLPDSAITQARRCGRHRRPRPAWVSHALATAGLAGPPGCRAAAVPAAHSVPRRWASRSRRPVRGAAGTRSGHWCCAARRRPTGPARRGPPVEPKQRLLRSLTAIPCLPSLVEGAVLTTCWVACRSTARRAGRHHRGLALLVERDHVLPQAARARAAPCRPLPRRSSTGRRRRRWPAAGAASPGRSRRRRTAGSAGTR